MTGVRFEAFSQTRFSKIVFSHHVVKHCATALRDSTARPNRLNERPKAVSANRSSLTRGCRVAGELSVPLIFLDRFVKNPR